MALTKVDKAIFGKHSEQQVIVTIPPAGVAVLEVGSPDPHKAIALTGIDGDFPPNTFKVRVEVPHPYISPHEGVLSPALLKVVNQNFNEVKPVVGYPVEQHAFFTVENLDDASEHELELVLGFIITDPETAKKYYGARWL